MLSTRSSFAALATTLVLAVALAAGAYGADPAGERVSAKSATATAKMLSGIDLDLSVVRVLRLDVGGERVEVVSLKPTLYNYQGSAFESAGTIMGFNPDRDTVVFMTRDAEGSEARRHQVAWSEVAKGDAFDFPVVTAQGQARTVEIRVAEKLQRPKADHNGDD
jgi:hypothetical protein